MRKYVKNFLLFLESNHDTKIVELSDFEDLDIHSEYSIDELEYLFEPVIDEGAIITKIEENNFIEIDGGYMEYDMAYISPFIDLYTGYRIFFDISTDYYNPSNIKYELRLLEKSLKSRGLILLCYTINWNRSNGQIPYKRNALDIISPSRGNNVFYYIVDTNVKYKVSDEITNGYLNNWDKDEIGHYIQLDITDISHYFVKKRIWEILDSKEIDEFWDMFYSSNFIDDVESYLEYGISDINKEILINEIGLDQDLSSSEINSAIMESDNPKIVEFIDEMTNLFMDNYAHKYYEEAIAILEKQITENGFKFKRVDNYNYRFYIDGIMRVISIHISDEFDDIDFNIPKEIFDYSMEFVDISSDDSIDVSVYDPNKEEVDQIIKEIF